MFKHFKKKKGEISPRNTRVKINESSKNRTRSNKLNTVFGMNNIKIGWKYGVVMLIILLLLVFATSFVAYSIREAQNDMDNLIEDADRAFATIELSDMINAKGLSALAYAQFGNPAILEDFEVQNQAIDERIATLSEQITKEEQVDLFNDVVSINQDLTDLFYDQIVEDRDQDDAVLRMHSNSYLNLNSISTRYLNRLRESITYDRDLAAERAETSQTSAQVILITSMLIASVIAVILFILISIYVSKNLKQVILISDKIASGDLTRAESFYQGNDEIGQLSISIEKMRLHLVSMIDSIKQTSSLVGQQSEQLNSSADDVKSGSQQIAVTMDELASGTETQANFASDLAETMTEFAERIQSINTSSQSISESTKLVLEETNLGNQSMNQSITQMGNIDQIVKDSVIKVEGLDQQTQEISQLVDVVKDIADQTNLLALNAAIEAARAGEQGRGFAVVANEVRKLAEQVANSVVEIAKIVDSIQVESKSVSTVLKQGYDEVAQGTKDIEATGIRFEAIESAIATMTTNVQTVMSGLIEINNDSEKVNEAVQEIASISEETSAGVEETLASSEQTSSAMEGVAEGANTLLDSANVLRQLIQQFKL
ncbi:MAG TPA: methyl-accepting chemotaxis protein [Bacilli bacterium]|nr:methyl-accepting chemotaxis protein [Bacilli bacterium]